GLKQLKAALDRAAVALP
ncbi:MAG: hypothetical protein KDE24_12580, partial [Caldilinea sp.]|nr:hypothetical protein [Caldilinea sp.]